MNPLLRKLLDPRPLEYAILDRDWIVRETSSNIGRFADVPELALCDRDIRLAFPEFIGVEPILSDILHGQQSYFELKGIARFENNNQPFYFDLSVTQEPGDNPQDIRLLVVFEDATERMILKQELMQRVNEANLLVSTLAAAKAYTDRIITAMADALLVTKQNGRIEIVNDAALDLFGYTRDELIDRGISTIFETANLLPEWREVVGTTDAYGESPLEKDLETDLETNLETNLEIPCRTKSGKSLVVAFSRSVIPTELPGLHKILYIGRDITERKRAAEQLEFARRQAELASQTKSNFLANMSHEIRTPMNAILGMTGLLLQTSLNPEQQDFIETIRLSSNALLNLINEILDLSKLEAGEMQLETKEFDLTDCVEEVVELLAPQAHAKGLEITISIAPDLPDMLRGDAYRLRQVLTNLIGNAIKFTAEGEVFVKVERSPVSLPKALPQAVQICFSTIDTGIGIAPEDRTHLFEPFSQVDASTTRVYGGTGLGLAICKQIVSLMGGTIGVDSEVGRGSKFWFAIPFARANTHPGTHADRGIHELAGRALLTVGNRATTQEAIAHWGACWRMRVEAMDLSSFERFLEKRGKRRGTYDLVALDLQLDGTDAIALGERLKTSPAFADTPLVLLVRSNERDRARACLDSGFSSYLVKPIRRSRLLASLKQCFGIEDAPEVAVPTQNGPVQRVGERFPLKILVAEDNPVNQKVALKQLEIEGFKADVVANGEQVLQRLSRDRYDVILMDCQMPVLDGYETTREIRRLYGDRRARDRVTPVPIVIAMTAHAMKEDRDKCLAAGMDDYISKPVHPEQLQGILSKWGAQLNSGEIVSEPEPRSRPGQPPDLFDLGRLERISEGDSGFIRELLAIFLEDLHAHIASLQGANLQDLYFIEREAHYIKGSSSNVGAVKLYDLAKELEYEAHQGRQERINWLLDNLYGVYREVVVFVEELLQEK
jgi:PAS domain S-box-containing protein